MKNKIINVDNIQCLDCKAKDYWSLINFFKSFSIDWYNQRNIYFESHHVYPKAEMNGTEIPIIVNLPYKYHFLVHYYRAIESDNYRIKLLNFNACQVMVGKNKNIEYIKQSFPDEFYEMKSFIVNNPSNVKKVINLETLIIYNSTKEAAKDLGIDYHYVINICKKQDEYYMNSCYKTKFLSYYDESNSIEYYKELLNHYKSIPNKKKAAWCSEDIKKRANNARGNKFTQSKSKKVIDLNTNVIYDSTTKAGEATGIDRHKVLISCREEREVMMRKHKCNFRYI